MRTDSSSAVLALSVALLAFCDPATADVRDTVPILKAPEAFHEELVLKPLNDGSVFSHFQFTTHLGTMMDEDHFDGAASNLCNAHSKMLDQAERLMLANYSCSPLPLFPLTQ